MQHSRGSTRHSQSARIGLSGCGWIHGGIPYGPTRASSSSSHAWDFRSLFNSTNTSVRVGPPLGNLGDVEPVGEGDKRTQQRDINRAKEYFEDYKARTAQKKPRGRR